MMNTEENTKRLEDILHRLQKHPDYEYAFTQCQRKGEDFEGLDLEEKGWECFNRDRDDYIDTRTYRRLKRPAMTKEEYDKLTKEASDAASRRPFDERGNNDWNTAYSKALNARGLKLVPGKRRREDGLDCTAPIPSQSVIWMYEYPSTIVPTE